MRDIFAKPAFAIGTSSPVTSLVAAADHWPCQTRNATPFRRQVHAINLKAE